MYLGSVVHAEKVTKSYTNKSLFSQKVANQILIYYRCYRGALMVC